MKERNPLMWIPLYVDKWIFGSTRIELEPAERSVFVDLMALGAKDSGFIRANEITPYLHQQLAGMLNIPVELLESTIKKCLEFDKLKEPKPGIYCLSNWNEYRLSSDYKYRLETGRRHIPGASVRVKSDTCPKKPGPRVEYSREENTQSGHFEVFWKAYPRKVGKDKALVAWKKLAPPLDACLKTLEWQTRQDQWVKDDGKYIPHPATWLNAGRWKDEPVRGHSVRPKMQYEGKTKLDEFGNPHAKGWEPLK